METTASKARSNSSGLSSVSSSRAVSMNRLDWAGSSGLGLGFVAMPKPTANRVDRLAAPGHNAGMKWMALAFAALLIAGAAGAQSDHFAFDAAKAQRRARFQTAYENMLSCVAETTPKVIGWGSRSKIKAFVMPACVGYISNERPLWGLSWDQVKAMTYKAIDREIDSLIPSGQ